MGQQFIMVCAHIHTSAHIQQHKTHRNKVNKKGAKPVLGKCKTYMKEKYKFKKCISCY